MEDVFYFTKASVTLEDIARLAREAGRASEFYMTRSGPDLRVYTGEEYTPPGRSARLDYWDWCEWDGEWWDALEDGPLERVLAYDPTSSFMITYHPSSLPILGRFLQSVLQVYGGWVGCDDNMTRVYDVTDVERLQCHPNPP